MTLTAHAVTGAAIAAIMPHAPIAAIGLAFMSHYALDAIPHWDYSIQSASIHPEKGGAMALNWTLVSDLSRIGLDAFAGVVLSLVLFPGAKWLALFCAIAGMLPDALQFVYARYPHGLIAGLQRFHRFAHSRAHLKDRPMVGIGSQVFFMAIVVASALAL